MTGAVDRIPAGTYSQPDDEEIIDAEVIEDDEVARQVSPDPSWEMLLDGFGTMFDVCHRGEVFIDDAWFVRTTTYNAEVVTFFELLALRANQRRLLLTVERQAIPRAHVVSWRPR